MTNSDSDAQPVQPGDLLDSGGDVVTGVVWRISLAHHPEHVWGKTPLLRVRSEFLVPLRILHELHREGLDKKPSVLGDNLDASWGSPYEGCVNPGEALRVKAFCNEGEALGPMVDHLRHRLSSEVGEVVGAWKATRKEAADLAAQRLAACTEWSRQRRSP